MVWSCSKMNAATVTLGKQLATELLRQRTISPASLDMLGALPQAELEAVAIYLIDEEDIDCTSITPSQLMDYLTGRYLKHEVTAVMLAIRLELTAQLGPILTLKEPEVALSAYNKCLEQMAYQNHLESTLLMLEAVRQKFRHCQNHFPAPVMEAARASQKRFLEELSACIEYTNEEEPTPPDQVRLREAVKELGAEL